MSSILNNPQETALLVGDLLVILTRNQTDEQCRDTFAYLLALLTTPVNADEEAYAKSFDDYTARARQYLDKTFPPELAENLPE